MKRSISLILLTAVCALALAAVTTLGGCAARSLSRVEGSHIEMRFACALPTIPRAATALADLLRQPMAFSTYRPSSHCEM